MESRRCSAITYIKMESRRGLWSFVLKLDYILVTSIRQVVELREPHSLTCVVTELEAILVASESQVTKQ